MKMIIRILILSVVSFVIGVGVNFLAPTPLPLIAKPEQFVLKHEEGVEIKMDEALNLWNSGEGVFVDARSEAEFKKGHIPGAFSVPYKGFEEGKTPEAVDLLPRDQTVVIYCDGADCHASQVVFDKLEEMDYPKENLKLFAGGWVEWVEKKLEIETSEGEENGG